MHKEREKPYLFLGFIVNIAIGSSVIIVVLILLLVFIVFIVKLVGIHVVTQLLELESLAGKPIDCARDKLLFDVLAKLIVKFEAFFDVGGDGVIIVSRWLWGREEIEEGFGRHGDLNDSGLFGV
jgi:hypothetical protein